MTASSKRHLTVTPCVAINLLSLCFPLVRFIGAAYSTGNAECWEAAYRCAEGVTGSDDGPLFVARAAGVVRVLRQYRDHDIVFLPASCNRLSSDEAKLMILIDAARDEDPAGLENAASTLIEPGSYGEAMRAATALADLSRQLPLLRVSSRVPLHRRGTITVKQHRRKRPFNQAS